MAVIVVVLVVLSLALGSAFMFKLVAASGQPMRAAFSWEDSDCVFGVPAPSAYYAVCGTADAASFQTAFLNRLQQPFGGTYPAFNRLYFAFPVSYLTSAPAAVAAFVRQAHARGIAVERLDGNDSWVTSTSLRQVPVADCAAVAAYNHGAAATDQLDGVHLDIEPQTLGKAWFTNTSSGKDRYNDFYEANFAYIFSQCRAALNPVGAVASCDVGDDYYYYVTDLWGVLKATPFVDYILIMDYHNSQAAFWNGVGGIGGVSRVLASLAGTSVPAVFAMEFQSTQFVTADITVWPNGTGPAEALLASTMAQFGTNPNFFGTAIHFTTPYFSLGPAGPIQAPAAAPGPTCTIASKKARLTADLYYFKCAALAKFANNRWTVVSNNYLGASPTTVAAGLAVPYRVTFYDTYGCTMTNYLPTTVACN